MNAQAGRIAIDGVDVARIGLDALRARLALVPQDSLLFRGTLRENLYVIMGAEVGRARGLTLGLFRAARAQGPAEHEDGRGAAGRAAARVAAPQGGHARRPRDGGDVQPGLGGQRRRRVFCLTTLAPF